MKYSMVICLFLLLSLWACNKGDEVIPQPFRVEAPSNLGKVPFPDENPFDSNTIYLGKKLFFETKLSGSNNISCASCHLQANAFADNVQFSKGQGGEAFRNTPTLFNLAWMPHLFWDGGATTMERQVFGALESEIEMNQNLVELIHELQGLDPYPTLFEKAFGNKEITTSTMAKALAQFERTLISGNSKYDEFSRGELAELEEKEQIGLQLVRAKCSPCHSGELFTDQQFHNIGLDSSWSDPANLNAVSGRYRISLDSTDLGAYKTPSLRNVEVSAPYMHDGRFATLSEVLNHFSEGLKVTEYTDPLLQNRIPLSSSEKSAIIAFLKTLTDTEFLENTDFQP